MGGARSFVGTLQFACGSIWFVLAQYFGTKFGREEMVVIMASEILAM